MIQKFNKNKKYIIYSSMLIIAYIFSTTNISIAVGNLENELSEVINNYNNEDIIIEDGISIYMDEVLDLSEIPNWKMSNDYTVEIDEKGILKPIVEGTVFLSQKINEKVYIIEVNISNKIKKNRLNYSNRNINVDRSFYKVFIDAGHGGNDNGAAGNGYLEDELNLQIAKKVESKLKEKGIEVKMSRISDSFLSLNERADLANEYNPDVFISIHQNSTSQSTTNAKGIETYRHIDKSTYQKYAQEVQNKLINETRATNRGVKSANFAVLRETNMPAILVECGFINNKEESRNLGNQSYQNKLAKGIADGIEEYLTENIKLNNKNEILPIIDTGLVTATSLNVRGGYGTSNSIIGKLSKGSKVDIVESKDGWYKIKYNNGYGYVSGAYIKINYNEVGIEYKAHVEDYGWQDWKSNGEIAGTVGKAKRLEAIYIKGINIPNKLKLKYKAHVEDYGWQDWKSNGEIAGTVGKAKRLEAIRIDIENLADYKVQYRAHVEDYGWQDWKSNGEIAGTVGKAKRLEGIEIRIVKLKN